MQADVLGLIDHTHSATTESLNDAVMRNGLADERLGVRHGGVIFGRCRKDVEGCNLAGMIRSRGRLIAILGVESGMQLKAVR